MSLRSLCAVTALLILVGCSSKRDLGNVPDGGGGHGGIGSGTAGQGGGGGQGGANAVPCDGGVAYICLDATLVCNVADCPSTGTAGAGGGAGRGGAGGSATGGSGGSAGTGGSSGNGGAAGGGGGVTGTGGSSGSGGAAGGGSGGRGGSGGSAGAGGTGGGGTGGSGGNAGAGGGTATFPSCMGLAPTCGPNRDQDCCSSAVVPGGSFNRSNDPTYPATVSPFQLDIYAVTVGRFRKFVADYYANGWRPAAGQGKNPHNPADTGWDPAWNSNLPPDVVSQLTTQLNCDGAFPTWTATPGGNENRPITCESWYEAFAFCAWDGGRLPTEAEYNFASAGGTEQRFYPWSNPPGDTTIDASYLSYSCMGDGSAAGDCAATDILVVGSKPKGNGRWGHADLVGNVLHWTRDWNGPYQMPCSDCAQLTTTDMWRLLRGGAYSYAASYQTSAFRFGLYFAYYRSSDIGFRCARDASSGTITERPVLTASSEPLAIVAGPDGNLWFTEYSAGKIGRITPAGTITEFATGVTNEVPGITVGPDNNLWFTEAGADKIGRITTAGSVTEFPLPATGRFPNEITKGPDGNLWFTEQHGNRIGLITTGGVVTEFPTPTANSEPGGITVGPDGNLWFAEHTGNKIGRITTAGSITEFLAAGNPTGIVAGADGNLWFTEEVGGKIGRITTSGSVVEFPIPTAQPSPEGITSGPDGNLWFTEASSNKIGRVTPAGTFKEFVVPSAGAYPVHIVTGPDGALWFTEEFGNRIGRLVP